MSRIAICGHPGTGKTTLAGLLRDGHRLMATDDAISLGWDGAARAVSGWFDAKGDIIVEGPRVPCGLRRWRDSHPGQPPPIERLIVLQRNYLYKSPLRLGLAHDESLASIAAWLGAKLVRR